MLGSLSAQHFFCLQIICLNGGDGLEQQHFRKVDPDMEKITDEKFIKIVETAILQSLLEKGQLARWQFDLCLEKLD